MAEKNSLGDSGKPYSEEVSVQRFNRRQLTYSLTALITALVVAAIGFTFAYQTIESGSSHVHAAESDSQVDASLGVDEGMTKEMMSPGKVHAEPTFNDGTSHEHNSDVLEDHQHRLDE